MAATSTRRDDAERGGRSISDQRPPLRRLLRYGLWVVIVLAWGYLFFGSEGLVAQLERRRELASLNAELERERARTAEMQRQVEALQHDDLAIESETRALLDFQRPGEVVYIVEEEDPLLRAESEGRGGD